MSATDKRRTCADCGADVPYGHYHTVLECIEKLKAVTAALRSRLAGHPASEPPPVGLTVLAKMVGGRDFVYISQAYRDLGEAWFWEADGAPAEVSWWWDMLPESQ